MAVQPGVNITATAPSPSPVPLDSKRNVSVFIGDMVSFVTGLSFIPATTVLVGLASRLTDDKALIGVVAMSWSVAWLIPQLVAARMVQASASKNPTLIIPSIIGRQTVCYLPSGWQSAVRNRRSHGMVLIASVVVFNFCDAIAGISYWDMMSRLLTPQRRGRTITTGQFFGSLLGIGSALIVERILVPGGLPFPMNYALIFVCAWMGFIVSLVICFFLQENPMSEEALTQSHEGSFFSHVREALHSDEVYRRLLVVRLLSGVESMTAAFYVVYVKERLGLPDSIIGIFSVALIVGGILGVTAFGAVSDRLGSRGVVRFAILLQFLAPLLALVMTLVPGLMEAAPTVVVAVFAVILAIDGAVGRSTMLGFSSYTLDRAPERRRAIYVGVFNTLGGVVGLTPVLGGAFLDHAVGLLGSTPAYAIMFGLAALCAGTGALLGFTLPKPELVHE